MKYKVMFKDECLGMFPDERYAHIFMVGLCSTYPDCPREQLEIVKEKVYVVIKYDTFTDIEYTQKVFTDEEKAKAFCIIKNKELKQSKCDYDKHLVFDYEEVDFE